jgi:arogenate dehydrogenase (NADP+)
MELAETTISTKGFDSLISLVDNTYHDSFDLYYGLFVYNENASAELARLEVAFDQVKSQLFGRLHELIRTQHFGDSSSATSATRDSDGH